MADPAERAAPMTLASLRRRANRRQTSTGQTDLFSDLLTASPCLLTPAEVAPLNLAEPAATPLTTPFPESVAAKPAHLPSSPQEVLPVSSAREVTVAAPRLAPLPEASSAPVTLPEPELEPEPHTWTVSGLVRHVRGVVERGYGQVSVEGEISNWRPSGSGHCYFTIKDAGAQLSAVMFRRQASLLRFRPADGDAVRLHGQLSVYESRGQMQLIVEWMQQVGLGAMLADVQRLKERLRREGLFDRKRPLPAFPRCIGIVTSLQGAALRDIVKVCRRRHAAVQMLIYPAAVQGPNCPAEIAAGLRWFNAHPERAEVVLVARGGGSWEDLHGFDHESVARAIAASVLPVITGIGHATDSTVADAAADVCAPTPSAAAELLTAAQHRVEERVSRLHIRLLRAGRFELLRAQQRLTRLGAVNVLRRVDDSLNRRAQRVDELNFRTDAALRLRLRHSESRLRLLAGRLERQNPALRVADARQRLQVLQTLLIRTAAHYVQARSTRLDRCETHLAAMNPLRVLERGYALVYGPDGHLLRDASVAPAGAKVRARLAQGELLARVLPSEALDERR